MNEPSSYSKREVSRAGAHLAARLGAVRHGERRSIVEPDEPDDLRARDAVEWWRMEHFAPMLAVHRVVSALVPDLRFGGEAAVRAVSFRPKRFETTIEKLTRELGKLADMVDIGGGPRRGQRSGGG